MKRVFNIPVLLLAFALLITISCKNKHINPSVEEMIVGTWDLSEVESDINANGKIDFGERIALPSGSLVQFNLESDQTGDLLVENLDERLKELLQGDLLNVNDFNWELLQNETQLLVNGEHVVKFQIVDISEKSMELHSSINDKSVNLFLRKK